MTVNDAIEDLRGRTLDGRFALDAFIARGGYGAVYRGTHLALRCPIAVKVLAVPDVYEGAARARFVEAFEAESLIVARLQHPAIVRVLDVGVTTVDGRPHPYMVFEWIDGATLEATLRAPDARPRAPREALSLLRPVFDAIASAHEAGVAHRDLKPANVMIAPTRRGEVSARVLDFGVAKVFAPDAAAPSGVTATGDERATFSLSHAAPEQVGRLRTGPWTDVHALALLLVEVLVGRRAYRGDTSVDLYARITTRERPTPRTFGVDVGPWEPVLTRALSVAPIERHPDAAALLADLDANLEGAQRAWDAPASADRSPPRKRAWQIALGVAACVALVTAGALRVGAARAASNRPRLPSVAPASQAATPRAAADAAVARALPSAPARSTATPRAARAWAAPRGPAARHAVRPRGATADGEIEIE